MSYKNFDYSKIRDFCHELFPKYGFSEKESKTITDILLMADLYGIESHGVQRLILYHNAMKAGKVAVDTKPEITFETPISATIDAHMAMGQLISYDAMQLAIDKAKKTGIGMVVVNQSNHYGMAGYYTKLAADNDLIGVCMSNTEAIMVPTFGSQAMLGSNPISVSMPADPTPFLFDAATTVVPRGKLEVYKKKELPLPLGWALDEKGLDCTDPSRVLSNIINKVGGGILPLGGANDTCSGHKGYGFGLICELFTSILAGGETSNHAVQNNRNRLSHCFWAIDYGIFGKKEEIKKNFSVFLDELRNSRKAENQSRIYIHGEKELESYERKIKEGIPVNEKTFQEMKDIGRSLGVDYAKYIGEVF